MRHARLAATLIALVAWALPAAALEVEAHKEFPAPGSDRLLRILSTADLDVFEPIIMAFQAERPGVGVDYTVAGSSDVMAAIEAGEGPFDLVISSAMDLQTKLANDGRARRHASTATLALPDWAKWRDQVFAFTQEPAVLVVSEAWFAEGEEPRSREALIALLRDAPERFRGRIGTYDVRQSGSGYLFATQDSRATDSFWRLVEVMGRLEPRLYCCSADMIRDVAHGKLAFAYNVLGSYAASRLKDTDGMRIVELEDYVIVMLRTALIPANARNVEDAAEMIDFLVGLRAHPELTELTGLPPIDEAGLRENQSMRPIRLGPGLLVFLDRLKRENFLRNWADAIIQK